MDLCITPPSLSTGRSAPLNQYNQRASSMADETQPTGTSPQVCCDASRSPLSCMWQPSVLYSQHFGLPPLLDPRDLGWMETLFRKLGSSSWPGYTRTSRAFTSLTVHRELSEGLSEVYVQETKWSVSLDVNHFAPTEIMVRTQTGFLVVEGKHEERQDEHGYISRSFVRKYKLPVGIIAESIQSCISGEGILTVEAKITSFPPPADITVSVQVQPSTVEDKQEYGLQREGLAEGGHVRVSERDTVQPSVPPRPDGKPVDEYDTTHPSALSVEGEQGLVPGRTAEDQRAGLSEEQRALIQKKKDELKHEQVSVSMQKVEDAGGAPHEVQKPAAGQLQVTQAPGAGMAQLEDQVGVLPDAGIQKPVADGQILLGEAEREQGQLGQADGQFQLGEADRQVQIGDGDRLVQLGEAEGQVQLSEAELERVRAGQTQEEIRAQLELQKKLMMDEKLQAKLGKK